MSATPESEALNMGSSIFQGDDDSDDHPPLMSLLSPRTLSELGPVDLFWFENTCQTQTQGVSSSSLLTQGNTSTPVKDSPLNASLRGSCCFNTPLDTNFHEDASFSPCTQPFPRYPKSPSDQLLTLGATMGGHDLSWTSSMATPSNLSKIGSGMSKTGSSAELVAGNSANSDAISSGKSLAEKSSRERSVGQSGSSSGVQCGSAEEQLVSISARAAMRHSVRLLQLRSRSSTSSETTKRQSLHTPVTPSATVLSAARTRDAQTTPRGAKQLKSETGIYRTPQPTPRRRLKISRRRLAIKTERLDGQPTDQEIRDGIQCQLAREFVRSATAGKCLDSAPRIISKQKLDDVGIGTSSAGTSFQMLDCADLKVSAVGGLLLDGDIGSDHVNPTTCTAFRGGKFELCPDSSLDAQSLVSENAKKPHEITIAAREIADLAPAAAHEAVAMPGSPSTGASLKTENPWEAVTDEAPKTTFGFKNVRSRPIMMATTTINSEDLDYGCTEDFNVGEVCAIAEEAYVCTKLMENEESLDENDFSELDLGKRGPSDLWNDAAEPQPCPKFRSGSPAFATTLLPTRGRHCNGSTHFVNKPDVPGFEETTAPPSSGERNMPVLISGETVGTKPRALLLRDGGLTEPVVPNCNEFPSQRHFRDAINSCPTVETNLVASPKSRTINREASSIMVTERRHRGYILNSISSSLPVTADRSSPCPVAQASEPTSENIRDEDVTEINEDDDESDIIQPTYSPGWDNRYKAGVKSETVLRSCLLYTSATDVGSDHVSPKPSTSGPLEITTPEAGHRSGGASTAVTELVLTEKKSHSRVPPREEETEQFSDPLAEVERTSVDVPDRSKATECEGGNLSDPKRQQGRSVSSARRSGPPVGPCDGGREDFRTAKGISISVDQESLQMKTTLLINSSNLPDIPVKNARPPTSDCTTRSNSLAVAAAPPSSFGGFTTAGGKTVTVSETHLRKARAKFEDDFQNVAGAFGVVERAATELTSVVIAPSGFGGFTTAGGKAVIVSETHLNKARAQFQEEFQNVAGAFVGCSATGDDSSVAPNKLAARFDGFTTAGGKSVTVSKEHLDKAKAKFEEESRKVLRVESIVGKDFGGNIGVRNESRKSPKNLGGFSTASGKAVCFSEEHLQRAKSIFDDEPRRVSDCEEQFEIGNGFGDVRGAADEGKTTHGTKVSSMFGGFSTAGGKAVSFSREHFERARAKFDEHDISPSSEAGRMTVQDNVEKPLLNGSGDGGGDRSHSSVTPSAPTTVLTSNALPNTILKLKSFECGFTLAGGKRASVSEKALREAREKLADDIENRLLILQERPSRTDVTGTAVATPASPTVDPLPAPPTDLTGVAGSSSASKNAAGGRVQSQSASDSVSFVEGETWDDFPQEFLATLTELTLQRDKIGVVTPTTLNHKGGRLNTETTVSSDIEGQPATSERDQSVFSNDAEVQESTRAFLEDESSANFESSLLSPRFARIARRSSVEPTRKSNASDVSTSSLKRQNNFDSFDEEAATHKRLCVQENGFKLAHAQSRLIELTPAILEMRRSATCQQLSRISVKREQQVVRKDGSLWTSRLSQSCLPLRTFVAGRAPCRLADDAAVRRGVKQSTLAVNCHNAEDYRFLMEEHYRKVNGAWEAIVSVNDSVLIFDDRNGAGKEEFYRSLLDTDGVDPRLLTQEWAFNHYRWIVWKLAATEVSFPTELGGRLLTPSTVARQLHYRYNVELDYSRRSALRRILERDDAPQKTMCLCVARVLHVGGGVTTAATRSSDPAPPSSYTSVLELTDGWYSLKTALDVPLTNLVLSSRIRPGMKLLIHGAELAGSTEACAPLEAPTNLFLKVNANCCRPARWDAKLGYQRASQPFPLPLNSLSARGGLVGRVDVVVLRVYPVQYLERLADGSTRVLNQRTNDEAENLFQRRRSDLLERVMSQVQRSVEADTAKGGAATRKYTRGAVKNLTTGEEIARALESFGDPSVIEESLTTEQKRALITHKLDVAERRQEMMRERLQRAMEQDAEQGGPPAKRTVSHFLKIRAAGLAEADVSSRTGCQITVWSPPEDLLATLEEGRAYQIYYLLAENRGHCGSRDVLQLKSIRRTRFMPVERPYDPSPFVACRRTFTPLGEIAAANFRPPCEEVDVVAVVVKLTAAVSEKPSNKVVHVFVADAERNVIGIKFWGGLEVFGLQHVIKPTEALAITDLQWRGHVRGRIPLLTATEHTRFSTKSTSAAMGTLIRAVPDVRVFASEVAAEVDDLYHPEKTAWTLAGATPGSSALGPPMSTSTPNHRPGSGCRWDGASTSATVSPMAAGASPACSNQLQRLKLERLQCYASPPPLPSVVTPVSRLVKPGFRDPRKRVLSDSIGTSKLQ